MRIGKRLCLGFSALLCFLVASSTPQGYGPPSPDRVMITYDLLDPSTSQNVNIRVHSRQAVWVKVINFNPFLYDLTISGQVVSYNQNFPQLLTAALAGSAPNSAVAKEEAADAKNRTLANTDYLTKKADFEVALEAVYTKLSEAERIVIDTIGSSDDLSQTAILDRIKERETALCGLPIPGPSAQMTQQILRTSLWSLITEVRTRWEILEKAFRVGLNGDEKKAHQAEYDAESIRWRTFEGTDRARFEGALNNAVSAWRSVEDSKFEISAGPFFADGDELIIKITVTRKAGLEARFSTKRICSEKPIARLRTKCGIKVDFSAGFAFGRPVDRAYILKDNVIVRSTKDEAFCAVSPAVFLHVYPRTGRDFALAGTFGIATNKSGEFDYHLGGSLLFGASQRFVLTIGINVSTISVLGGGLEEGDPLPAGISTIPLANVLHFGYGIGISFNLGGI